MSTGLQMGYKTNTTNGLIYTRNSPRDNIGDSRVYDHYDYALDEFETYDEDDLEIEETFVGQIEDGSAAHLLNKGLLSKDSKIVQCHAQWDKLKSEKALQEFSDTWFSQAPFELEPIKVPWIGN